LNFQFPISNFKFGALLFVFSVLLLHAQNEGADSDGDGLLDSEEPRYGLSPYMADTNQNNRPDLSHTGTFEAGFSPDRPVWTGEWTPEAVGTYRFYLDARSQLEFRINNVVVPPFAPNVFEVIGVPSEKMVLALEGREPGAVPQAGGTLAAYFIDGQDLDLDGLSFDWEMELHTDPAQPDTDGDGLSDGEEVIRYDTDPLSADSNTNGLPDYVEILTIPAHHTIDLEGYWEEKLNGIAARNPVKAALYRLPLPYPGIYRIGVVIHPTSTGSGTLKVYLDGELRGETAIGPGPLQLYHWVEIEIDRPVSVNAGRPSLSHPVRFEWENKIQGIDAGELILQQIYVDYIDNQVFDSP
jgi:hypothetical protein